MQTLSYTYPLKLISPSNWEKDAKIATVYLVSYGGGLVAGDSVQLSVEVGAGTGLLVLTQGDFSLPGNERFFLLRFILTDDC